MKNAYRLRVLVPFVMLAMAAVPGCSKKPDQGPGGGGAAPPPKETVSSIDPVVKPEKLQTGVSLTTFPNNRFTGPGETKSVVSAFDFDCAKNPYTDKEASLRYEGYLQVDKDGSYVFQILSDDQSSLHLNGMLVLDQNASTTLKEKTVQLKAGVYALRLDYQNNVGAACLIVRWSNDNKLTLLPIPGDHLFH